LCFGNLITIAFYLATEEDRETVEHVLDVYADGCAVARSLRDSIGIASKLELVS
jgi:uncharacterized OsmC-like protein